MAEFFDQDAVHEQPQSTEDAVLTGSGLVKAVLSMREMKIGVPMCIGAVAGSLGMNMFVHEKFQCPGMPDQERIADIRQQVVSAPLGNGVDTTKRTGLVFAEWEKVTPTNVRIAEADSPPDATKIADAFMSQQLGVRVVYEQKRLLSTDEVVEYKNQLMNMVLWAAQMPKQIFSDVKTVTISDELADAEGQKRKMAPEAYYVYSNQQIVARPRSVAEVLPHETFHGIDSRQCQAFIDRDDAVESQNPTSFAYSENNLKIGRTTVTYTRYGASDVGEDKADTFAGFVSTRDTVVDVVDNGTKEGLAVENWLTTERMFGEQASFKGKVIGNKLLILLARLDDEYPGIAQYLASASKYLHKYPDPYRNTDWDRSKYSNALR